MIAHLTCAYLGSVEIAGLDTDVLGNKGLENDGRILPPSS